MSLVQFFLYYVIPFYGRPYHFCSGLIKLSCILNLCPVPVKFAVHTILRFMLIWDSSYMASDLTDISLSLSRPLSL